MIKGSKIKTAEGFKGVNGFFYKVKAIEIEKEIVKLIKTDKTIADTFFEIAKKIFYKEANISISEEPKGAIFKVKDSENTYVCVPISMYEPYQDPKE